MPSRCPVLSGETRTHARIFVVARSGGMSELDEARRLAADDRRPDPLLAEDWLGATSFSGSDLDAVGGTRRRVLALLPEGTALALGAWWRRDEFDVAVTWTEALAYPMALLMALTPHRRQRHIAIMFWPLNLTGGPWLKRTLKRLLAPLLARRGMDRLLVPGALQRRLVVERWSIPADRILSARWPIDTDFWRPIDAPGDTICSVGREMRDFKTLITALAPLAMPCHIAAGTRLDNSAYGTDDVRASATGATPLRDGITVGYKAADELRDLYARSRLVVIPIMPSENDNGATAILEAMSMGRTVITTDTAGKLELLRDDVNCVLVPPRDPEALRAAIENLWDDSERRERIGREARAGVLAAHGLRQWMSAIRLGADELSGRRTPPDTRQRATEELRARHGPSGRVPR